MPMHHTAAVAVDAAIVVRYVVLVANTRYTPQPSLTRSPFFVPYRYSTEVS